MAEIEFREYQDDDEHGILETFNQTFAASWGEGYVDRSVEHWSWLYRDNPAGHRIMLGVDRESGKIACQYAGIPMRVRGPDGAELSFFHAVDSMVHPDYRQGLRKRGLFLEVAERYFERFGGAEDHLGFGYPIRPAWRIGERFLGYRLVRTLDFYVRNVEELAAPPALEASVLSMRDGGGVEDRELDALFEKLGPQHACVTIKDARYLRWRYGAAAPSEYFLALARREGEAVGWWMLRAEGGLVPDAATIGDFLAPDDTDVHGALLAASLAFAHEHTCAQLVAVTNPQLPFGRALAASGFAERPSSEWFERKLGSRDWTSGLSQEWLAENWSYCLGDSDLF